MGTLEEHAQDKWKREGDSSIPFVPTVAATDYSIEISIYDTTSISEFEKDESYEPLGMLPLYDKLTEYGCYNVDYNSMSGCYITFTLWKEDDTEANWNSIRTEILTYIEEARIFRANVDAENA